MLLGCWTADNSYVGDWLSDRPVAGDNNDNDEHAPGDGDDVDDDMVIDPGNNQANPEPDTESSEVSSEEEDAQEADNSRRKRKKRKVSVVGNVLVSHELIVFRPAVDTL